jgi:hypothetical protein
VFRGRTLRPRPRATATLPPDRSDRPGPRSRGEGQRTRVGNRRLFMLTRSVTRDEQTSHRPARFRTAGRSTAGLDEVTRLVRQRQIRWP